MRYGHQNGPGRIETGITYGVGELMDVSGFFATRKLGFMGHSFYMHLDNMTRRSKSPWHVEWERSALGIYDKRIRIIRPRPPSELAQNYTYTHRWLMVDGWQMDSIA